MKRVIVVGFGFMGMTHTKSILENNSLELVAVVDKRIDAVESNLKNLQGNFSTGTFPEERMQRVKRFSSLEEALQYEDFDAVFICVHTDLHYEMTKKALLHGKHVFLEKPFLLDIKQAEELISLARQKDLILMIGHVVRFMPAYQQLKQWIENMEFGKLDFLSMTRFSGLPVWGQWREKQLSFGSSGGALFDLIIHDIDFANYLLGQPGCIKSNILPGALSKHDYVSAMWTYYDKNIHIKIEGGNIFHPTFPFQAGFIALFEKATVIYSFAKPLVIEITDENGIVEKVTDDPNEGFKNEVDYFSTCVSKNLQPFECMPESALQTIQLCYNHLT